VKVFNDSYFGERNYDISAPRREFIMQHRAYRAGMEVAKPYEMCRVKTGWFKPARVGIIMEDLGRTTMLSRYDNKKWDEHNAFVKDENARAKRVGLLPGDTHLDNAMMTPGGLIKRIDLGHWEYSDRHKTREAAKLWRTQNV
jgi:hypothetical protein